MKELVVKPNCQFCTLNCGSQWIVNGEGTFDSPDLFIIGEAPGNEEHYAHRPFIGKSGKLLRATLDEIQKQKEFTYYVTNVVQCRMPNPRQPTKNEITNCYDRLVSEIKLSRPKAILLLGGVAVETILTGEKVGQVRGKLRSFQNIPVIATWHPSYILRNDFSGEKKGHENIFPTFAKDIQTALSYAINGKRIDWSIPRKVTWLNSGADLVEILNDPNIFDGEPASIDLETWKLDPYQGYPLWFGIHFKNKQLTYIIHCDHFQQVSSHWDPDYPVIIFDSKMECRWFHRFYQIQFTDIHDPLLKAYCLDERTVQVKKDLKTLGQEISGAHDWSIPVAPFIKDSMQNCPLPILEQYLAYDVEIAADVNEELDKRMAIEKENDLNRIQNKINELKIANIDQDRINRIQEDWHYVNSLPSIQECYDQIIKPGVPFVRKITANGIRLDLDYLEELKEKYSNAKIDEKGKILVPGDGILDKSLDNLRRITGIPDFNPNSPQQVSKYLYDVLKVKDFSDGKRSTDEKTLDILGRSVTDVEFIDALLEHRGHVKIHSTYLVGLIDKCSPDGRIRFEYKPEGTETGRLSGDGQQIPRPTDEINIRKAFLCDNPDEDELFDADYKQLELVTGAHLSDDDELIKYINAGGDMHKEMAAEVLRKHVDLVTKIERQFGKNADFAVMYDTSPDGFMWNFGKDFPFLSLPIAKHAINHLRQKFPKLYFNGLNYKRFVKEHGFIQTMFGRKRRFPLITTDNFKDVMKKAVNTPIQGAGSDICFLAAMRIAKELPEVRIHLLNHDSIVGSKPKGMYDKEICEIMSDVPFDHKVNFGVDIKVGDRWGI